MDRQMSARGRRWWVPAGAAAIAVAAALAAGCGSSSSGSAAAPEPVATVTTDAGVAYVHGLDDATKAMSGLAAAVLDPTAPAGTRGPRIEAELTRLEAAAAAMQPLTLPDATVDQQRRDLLAALPPFEEAMRAVVAAGREDAVNGGLELVQQRAPILAGVDATLTADAGAIDALGESARAALTQARADLQGQLADLRSHAAG